MTTDRTRASAGSRTGDPASTRQDTPFNGDVVILNRRAESDTVVSLELGTATAKPLPPWEPGAHIDVVLPDGLTRQYSLTGRMHNQETWRIGVLREPDSRGGSQWIHERAWPGARLHVRGPRNNFPLRAAPRYLFIAGGIGITPIMSMVRHLGASGGPPFRLYYLTRSPAATAFRDELAALGGRVVLHHDDGDPSKAFDLWPVLERTTGAHLYCCGPRPLLEAVRDMTGHWSTAKVHFESFLDAAATRTPADRPFSVRLARANRSVGVGANESILDALRRAGLTLASSCESGTCGTCRTGLLGGEADHRDLVLSDAERERAIMICVSRARSDALELDL